MDERCDEPPWNDLEIRRRAAIGEPCRRPSGEPYVETRRYARDLGAPRYHAPRVDRYCDAYASACVIAWRGDLRDGLAPARVLREIRSSAIYRLAARDGRVRAVPAQTTWPHATIKSLERAIADLTAERPDRDGAAKRAKDAIDDLEQALEARRAPARRAESPADVIARWGTEGPLVHEPTGLETLDEATDGGPVYGTRWYVQGAPDAGKTALVLAEIAATYAERGIAVGLLSIDEEPDDVVTRLVQRLGFEREAAERREASGLARMRGMLSGVPIRIYDRAWTIEDAAADLAAWAREIAGGRAMLGIDSIQAVRCAVELGEVGAQLGTVQTIEARVRAVRDVAIGHRLIAIATSEMGRAGYRSRSGLEEVDPLATAKWSSAIEYGARVMISLTSVQGHADIIRAELPKNKHGTGSRRWARDAAEDRAIYLRIDRARQTLIEVDRPEDRSDGPSDEDREAAEDARRREMAERILAALVKANAKGARLTARDDLRALVSGANDLKAKAVSLLISEGRIAGGRGKPFGPVYAESDGDT